MEFNFRAWGLGGRNPAAGHMIVPAPGSFFFLFFFFSEVIFHSNLQVLESFPLYTKRYQASPFYAIPVEEIMAVSPSPASALFYSNIPIVNSAGDTAA